MLFYIYWSLKKERYTHTVKTKSSKNNIHADVQLINFTCSNFAKRFFWNGQKGPHIIYIYSMYYI